MFHDRSRKRTSTSVPSSTGAFATALLEPALAVLSYVVLCAWFDVPFARADLILCLLVLALAFPGRDRLDDTLLAAAVELWAAWLRLLVMLALGAWLSSSFGFFDPKVLLAWALVTPLLQWGVVCIGQRLARWRATRPERRRVAVVIGAGPLGVKTAAALRAGGRRGLDFAGYFDDRTDERVRSEAAPQRLGTLKEAAAYVHEHAIDEVYITLPLGSQPRIVELLGQVQGTAAALYFVPDVFGIGIIQGRLREVDGLAVVGIRGAPLDAADRLAKRASDLVGAALMLAALAPLLLAIGVGVKLGSAGPVLLRQARHAPDGKEVIAYRFRAPRAADGALTPFGAFLRRHRLDGLPQLVNVLQGRMSIVGPRAHAAEQRAPYRRLLEASLLRPELRPGITGWAQVHGHDGDADSTEQLQARVEYDLAYLRNWSLALDLQIVLRTIALMLRGDEARATR